MKTRPWAMLAMLLVGSIVLMAQSRPVEKSEADQITTGLDMPIIGRVIGLTLDEAFGERRLLNLPDDEKMIDRLSVDVWSETILSSGLQRADPNTFCTRFAGSSITSVYMRDDQIYRVDQHFKRVSNGYAKRIIKRLGEVIDVIGDLETPYWRGVVINEGVRIAVALRRSGRYSQRMAYGAPDELHPNGPAILTFEVNSIEWYLWHHDVSDEIAESMRARKLAIGMDEEQMDATLSEKYVGHVSSQGEFYKTVVWYTPAYRGRKRLIVTATFQDGRITSLHQY